MNKLHYFTDEDIYGAVAGGLRRAGFDALSTPEAGRLGESDDSQLHFAAQESRVFVTFNVAHFTQRHSNWLKQDLHHSGIVVSSQRPVGDTLRRLLNLASTGSVAEYEKKKTTHLHKTTPGVNGT